MAPRISIVIPVYNEEEIISSAAADLVAGLDQRNLDYEVIFAENGSRDRTPQLLEEICSGSGRLRWFHNDTPNYGSAMKRGILEAKGELVVCDEIDLCDHSFYDAAIPLLEHADMVVGSKAARGSSDERPAVRRLATWSLNTTLRVALGFKGTDTHGLKAFRREKLLPVLERCGADMDVFASEFVIRAWHSVRVEEIPIQLHEKRKPSIHLFRRVPNVLKQVARLVYVIRVKGE
ncbi:MAG: glycosyltransferase family 2 protein [Archangiaceae bacterium]|nr:glycosyltransferase family 2 protein [Archangiaceae bacterium]